jgi:hypothetical protein
VEEILGINQTEKENTPLVRSTVKTREQRIRIGEIR